MQNFDLLFFHLELMQHGLPGQVFDDVTQKICVLFHGCCVVSHLIFVAFDVVLKLV